MDNDKNSLILHPITLAFRGNQAELEPSFAAYYFSKNLSHLRFCHYISLIFYLLSVGVDLVVFMPAVMPVIGIRCGIVAPCFIVGLFITYRAVYQKVWQQISCFYVLITGSSFIAFMVVAPKPDSYTYYVGIGVCMMFGYAFIRQRFLWASAAGGMLLLLFFCVSVIIHMPPKQLLIFGFYLTVINGLGMLIAYSFEIQSRKDYLLTQLLKMEKQKVDDLVTGLEKEVQKRTLELQTSNKELTREIAHRKTMEIYLRASEERYRSLQSNIPIGLYRISGDRLISVNPAMRQIFRSATENQLLSKPIRSYFCKSNDFKKLLKQLTEQGNIVNEEIRLRRDDGSELTGLINVTQVTSNDGGTFFYDGTLEDITDRKMMADEKEKLTIQLRQAYKMEAIGNLAGGIAHDFNNILTSAMGYTELSLDEAKSGTRLEKHLQELYLAWKRARDLVQQILAFARKSDEVLKPLQVSMVAKEVLKFIRSSIPSTINIRQNIRSDSLILGNPVQMHQIFMNLCTNAAHAMDNSGGTLMVEVVDVSIDTDATDIKRGLKNGEYVKIIVTDTGTGIPAENIGLIFDPYFTTKEPEEGTGLGLSMVHGIVKSYGGEIGVDSTLGVGSAFTIFLPITKKRSDYQHYKPKSWYGGTERILFVDDEPSIASLGQQMLESLGYSVSSYTSSTKAIDVFKENPTMFDLIITDMTMPNMTGEVLAKELRQVRQDIPVILCTGFSKRISSEEAPIENVNAILHKPISKQTLGKTIRDVLDNAAHEIPS